MAVPKNGFRQWYSGGHEPMRVSCGLELESASARSRVAATWGGSDACTGSYNSNLHVTRCAWLR